MLQRKLCAALVIPGEKRSDRFFRLFPWVWLVAAYCITMLVLCLHGRNYIDSDMSSEMVLANLLNQEGGLLSTNWWYSTELRVFCLQPFYRVGLLLFPHDWYAARMLGQGLCMLLLVAVYLYAWRGMGFRSSGAWSAGALVCPFGTWYLWYGPFGGYYLPHMIWILLSFGAILHLTRAEKAKQWIVPAALLVFSSAASGLNGIKGLMEFYLPMLAAATVAAGLQWHLHPDRLPRRALRQLGAAAGAAVIAAGGYLFNSVVLSVNHSFSNYNDRSWTNLSIETLLDKWADFLTLFGYPVDSLLNGGGPLFSLMGILAAFSLLTAGAFVFSLIRLLLRWRELDEQRILPLLMGAICLVQGLIFSCTGRPGDTNASYWLTVVPFVFLTLQMEGETEHFRLRFTRRAAGLAFCVCIAATSVSACMQFFQHGFQTNPHLAEVCDWLEDEGYTQGYATFWNGNVLTEWSDGQIEMWVTNNFNTLEPYEWLQKTSHVQPPEGPVFLLTTMEELQSMNLTQLYWWSDVVYEDGEEIADRNKHYVVMAYDSAAELQTAVAGAQSWAAEGAE